MCSSDLFPSHDTSAYENGAAISNMKHLAANKTVAWIDYMTNYNRTFGDFAAGGAPDFMVLNRRYEVNNLNQIDDLTTYIDPQKYIEIFADTDLTSQNFWVQTVVQATRRGNYSAYKSWVTGYDQSFLSRWRRNLGSTSVTNYGSIDDLFKCRP